MVINGAGVDCGKIAKISSVKIGYKEWVVIHSSIMCRDGNVLIW